MNRRAFLQTMAAGAVAAVIPLPLPASSSAVFIRYCKETTYGEYPTNKREISNQQKFWESVTNWPEGVVWPGFWLKDHPQKDLDRWS